MLFQEVDEGGGSSAGDAGADFPLGKGAQGYAKSRSKLGLGEAEAAAQGQKKRDLCLSKLIRVAVLNLFLAQPKKYDEFVY